MADAMTIDNPRTKARATDPATSHAAAAQANFAAAHRVMIPAFGGHACGVDVVTKAVRCEKVRT